MFESIKKYLPGSSRSLHAMHEELSLMHAELLECKREVTATKERMEAHDSRTKSLLWYMMRDENETEEEMRLKFFHSLPRARGGGRDTSNSAILLC